jgi:asparagine synthase (glutamine-hydrolysing)
MCGICGVLGNAPPGIVEAMTGAMRHRGPDDTGIFREEGVSLGMARLAIIDLTPRARQPMRNEEGSVWIVYNGEAYNFRQERAVLESEGQGFRSDSDTEVVLRMYERYGDDFLLRIRGMFSLAIYDKRKGRGRTRLLLARDPLGIKPLLYARAEGRFLFASEIKAILTDVASGPPDDCRWAGRKAGTVLESGDEPQARREADGLRGPRIRSPVYHRGERSSPYGK